MVFSPLVQRTFRLAREEYLLASSSPMVQQSLMNSQDDSISQPEFPEEVRGTSNGGEK